MNKGKTLPNNGWDETEVKCPECGEFLYRNKLIVETGNDRKYSCFACGFERFAESDNEMHHIAHELEKKKYWLTPVEKGETDYHAKQDYGKAKLSLVPRRIIWDVAAIREYGNNKYPDGGPDNWREVEPERYRDAAYRHFLGYLDDPRSVDSESGFPHLWHLACNIAFLCEMEDIYLSKNPEVVERLKKEFGMPVEGEDGLMRTI